MKTLTEITGYYGPLLAKGAFELGAIRLSPSDPFTWASGYRMPIYNDNRQFLAMPKYRALIRDAFADMLSSLGVNPDNIAGTATAGIPHATSLADMLYKPLTYVRSSSKDHGLGHQIEGLGRKKISSPQAPPPSRLSRLSARQMASAISALQYSHMDSRQQRMPLPPSILPVYFIQSFHMM